MKRKFSGVLSILLTIIMTMSLIQIPAFAATPAFRDTDYTSGHKYYMAPYGDELVHLDFYATDAASYTANNGGDFVSIDDDGIVSITDAYAEKGSTILNITAKSADETSKKTGNFNPVTYPIGYKVHETIVGTQYTFENLYIHDFSDGTYALSDGLLYNTNNLETVSGTTTEGAAFSHPATTILFENADVIKDADGNGYMAQAEDAAFIGFRPHHAKGSKTYNVWHSTVMQFDLLLSSEKDFNVAFVSSANSILKWNHTTQKLENLERYTNKSETVSSVINNSVAPGWHTVKFMFDLVPQSANRSPNPYRVDYQRGAVFFDDELIIADFELPELKIYNTTPLQPTTTPENVIRFEGAEGIDNFKYYGSSTPHAYGVELVGEAKSGAAVSASASSYSFFADAECDTAETTYEYTYYVSNSADSAGAYTKIVSTDTSSPLYVDSSGKLVINSDCTDRYIKIGARACYRGGKSPEIMSKEVYKIQGYADGFTQPYIIYDADTATAPFARIYDKFYDTPREIVTIGGRKAVPWGPKNENTLNMETVNAYYDEQVTAGTLTEEKAASSVQTIKDAWESYGDFANRPSQTNTNGTTNIPLADYQYLVVEMYSANNTNHPFLWRLYNGGKFYKAGFNVNWEGEWKKIRLALAGGLNDTGEFTTSTDGLTWKPYEATSMYLTATASSTFYPDTEVYIGKIYLEGNREEQTVANEKGEYILPDYYDPNTMTDYVSMVKENHPNKSHPRLLVTDEIIERIKTKKDTDAFMKKAYAAVEAEANTLLASDPESAYTNNGVLKFSRNVEEVAKYCGLMYLLTGDDAYAARVWEEAEVMINSDEPWYDTSTGLDSAHIANGMALLYDWCYDCLDANQKLAIRNALMKNAFAYAQRIRGGAGYMGFRNNVVAANSKGFMTAALAICDESGYEDFCNEFINNVVTYLPKNLAHQLKPDGAYSEGPGYWKYTIYSLMFMTDAMLTSIGSDGGIQEMEGLDVTGYFPIAVRGTNSFLNLFNYSDANRNYNQYINPVYHYLANRYNAPAIRASHLANLEAYPAYYQMEDLLWYNPELDYDTDWASDLTKDYFLDGLEPIVSMRSGYEKGDNFIAAKGGNSKTGHDQYDAGTFVLDALGNRWLCDLGADVYGGASPDNYYYRVRTEGHNCIVFDPKSGGEDGFGQTVGKNEYDTKTPVVDSDSADSAAFSVLDLQPSYQETVKSYKRGFALVNDRTQFIVQDEFETKEAFELYSYFHTSKNNSITINADGKSLIMENETNLCRVDFITDIPEFEIGVMEAVHHPSSPQADPSTVPEGATQAEKESIMGYGNSSVHKFYLHAKNVQNATITVVFTPMTSPSSAATLPTVKALADWDQYLDEYDIYINNIDGTKVNISSEKDFDEATIILAAYKDDALVAVKSVSCAISKGTKDYTITGFDKGEGTEVKAFVWNDLSSTLKPLAPSK